MKRHPFFALPLLALTTFVAQAQDYKVGAVTIHQPHAQATLPGQPVGAGYLTVVNQGRPDRLLAAEAAVSKSVELHAMAMDGDVMRMREVDGVELPTGRAVEFKPGGYHLMLVDLKAPLKVGDSFPMTLRFQKAGKVTVQMKVQGVGAEPARPVPGHQMKH